MPNGISDYGDNTTVKAVALTIFVSLVLLASPMARAQEKGISWHNGNWLVDACEDGDRWEECQEYILGVMDGVNLAANGRFPLPYCLPKQIDSGQLIRVVRRYLNNHPEDLYYAAASEVTAALKNAFPCNEQMRP